MNRKIGLLGGSFNPIHIGHITIAQKAVEKFNLNKVYFIPNGNPPHKGNENLIDSIDRYNMCKLLVEKDDNLDVLDIELNEEKTNYTVDTLNKLKDSIFKTDEIYFIVGADSILEMETWKNYKKLFDLTKFICAYRPNYDLIKLEKKIYEYKNKFNAQIYLLDIPLIDVSSTDIRKSIANNDYDIEGVPKMVMEYIRKNNLYKK